MKKAALFLMMSSTAFAAPQKVTSQASRVQSQAVAAPVATKAPQAPVKRVARAPQKPAPQLARKIVHGKKQQPLPLTIAPQAPQAARPQAARPQAPQRTARLSNAAPKQALATTAEPGIKAPKFGDFELKAQLRNTMTMARAQELQNIDGQNFGLGTEVRLGLMHNSGWGFNLTGQHQTNNYADSGKNTGTNGDASLMLYAPSFYKDDFVNVHGVGRYYAPTSEKSRLNNVQSITYYNYIDLTFGHNFSATNLTIARFFDRDVKGDGDLKTMVYNAFEVYHQTTKSIALSFGAQYENDGSYANGSGTQVDLYPFIDFTFIPNVLIETKYYFPVFVGGNGGVGATGAALDQSQAELFVKIAI